MRPYIFTTLLIILAASATLGAEGVASPDSLTITEAVRLTLASHPAIEEARSALAAADAHVGIKESSKYPEISLIGDYTHLGPVASIDLNNSKFNLYPADNFDFYVGLNKTLYDGGKTSTEINLARTARQSSEDNIDVVEFNLAYQTIAACNSILILHQNIDVIQEQIDALTQHTEEAQKKVKAGTATDFDVLTTQVRIARANDQKIEAQHALDRQENILRQLTGILAEQPINLSGSFVLTPLSLNTDSLIAVAEAQRPELAIAHDAEAVAAVKSDIARLGMKPTLDVNITTGFKNGYVPNIGTLKGNYTAGLMLHLPLYDGYKTRYEEGQAKANLNVAKEHTNDLTRMVITDVRQAVVGANSSHSKIENAELQLKQAEQALQMARSRYDAGVITNLDLLDAETSLAEAKLIRLTALYDYAISLVALDKATGRRSW